MTIWFLVMGFPIAPHWPWVNLRLNLSYHRPLLSGFLLVTQTHQNRSPLGCSVFDSHMAMSITVLLLMGDKTVALFFTSTASPRHQLGNCSKPLSLIAFTSHWHYHSQLVLNPLNFMVIDITCFKIFSWSVHPWKVKRKGDTVYTVELQQNCFTINGSAFSQQVAKAEKSKRPPKKEESAPIVPKTWREQVAAVFPEFLKSSAQARTSSLTIAGLAYTEELQKTLLTHAQLMEKTYSTFKKSVDEKPADKDCEKMKAKMEDQMKTCQKLQALLFMSIMSSKNQSSKETQRRFLSSCPQSMLIFLWNGFPNFYDGHSSFPQIRDAEIPYMSIHSSGSGKCIPGELEAKESQGQSRPKGKEVSVAKMRLLTFGDTGSKACVFGVPALGLLRPQLHWGFTELLR